MPAARTDDGVSIAYSAHGSGPRCVVFLHAWGASGGYFAETIAGLDRGRCGRSPSTCGGTATPTSPIPSSPGSGSPGTCSPSRTTQPPLLRRCWPQHGRQARPIPPAGRSVSDRGPGAHREPVGRRAAVACLRGGVGHACWGRSGLDRHDGRPLPSPTRSPGGAPALRRARGEDPAPVPRADAGPRELHVLRRAPGLRTDTDARRRERRGPGPSDRDGNPRLVPGCAPRGSRLRSRDPDGAAVRSPISSGGLLRNCPEVRPGLAARRASRRRANLCLPPW
jgi:hypothetical protein